MQLERLRETITTYRRYEWRLHSILLRPETRAQIDAQPSPDETLMFEGAPVRIAEYDAAWFTRQSGAPNRDAWELRLVAESPYALFEVFEPDEPEEDRADVRREMEARMEDHTSGRRAPVDDTELPLDE